MIDTRGPRANSRAGPGSTLATDRHKAFAVMAIDCLLIDTLDQFEKRWGPPNPVARCTSMSSSGCCLGFAPNLPTPIRRPTRPDLVTETDLLYSGCRSRIVHEAHIPPSRRQGEILRNSQPTLRARIRRHHCRIARDPSVDHFILILPWQAFPAGTTQARGGHLRDGELSSRGRNARLANRPAVKSPRRPG